MSKLRNILIGAGVAAVGAIGTKKAVDYLKNRDKEEVIDETEGDVAAAPAGQVAYANVAEDSVQNFLDVSFGDPGRYQPTRAPKVFEYEDQQYMVIWAYDNKNNKNQMMAFRYTDDGRHMIASVGYTGDKTDYNMTGLDSTPFAVEVNGSKITSGKGDTDGADEVDFVLA